MVIKATIILGRLKAPGRRFSEALPFVLLWIQSRLCLRYCYETRSFERARGFERIDLQRRPQTKMKLSVNEQSIRANYCRVPKARAALRK